MKPVFALIDCNNFFVSCERLFRPDLEGRPVVVLSSNDGCVVSRSNEAKALGIKMAAPAFKSRQLFKEQGVVQFSANFELYGDISERMTRVMTSITPRTEVYSVDESFLDLSQLEIPDYETWARIVRKRLLHDVGIPASIGIAPTKTLAKLAGERAKQDLELADVLDLNSLTQQEREVYLLNTPIKDIWGIGWRLKPKLQAEGIYNALDVARTRPQHIQQLMGINGRQLVAELNGTSAHPLQAMGKVRQTISHGRQFGQDTSNFAVIESALASLGAKAAFGLRKENLLARHGLINLSSNRHRPGYQRIKQPIEFATPTADTGHILSAAINALRQSFNPRMSYHRADILFYDLITEQQLQTDLFGKTSIPTHNRSQARLKAVDQLNTKYGKQTVHYAAEDLSNAWLPKKHSRSPRYTTDWSELPVINGLV